MSTVRKHGCSGWSLEKVEYIEISKWMNCGRSQWTKEYGILEKVSEIHDKYIILKAEVIKLSTNLPKYLKRIQEKLSTIIG